MNPKIPADYREVGRWLWGVATSHAKRESSRLEAVVEMEGAREGRSYGLRLVLGGVTLPPAGESPAELTYTEVAEGRARFAWCDTLSRRIRADSRRLVESARASGSQSA